MSNIIEELKEKYQGKLLKTNCSVHFIGIGLEPGEFVVVLDFYMPKDILVHMTCLSKDRIGTDWFYIPLNGKTTYLEDYYSIVL
jgi:hypothetical protein